MRLSATAARDRLSVAAVVRLATVDHAGRPHIVVTTFALDGDCIYTAVDQKPKRTRELRRLENIRGNPAVSVLADHYDEDWSQLWWARADGRARVLTDPDDMAEPIRLLVARYPQYEANPPIGPVIAVDVFRWSGWTFSADPGTTTTATPAATVVAAIVVDAGRVLLARRRHSEGSLSWHFPGGKAEPGESAEQAAAREVHEEVGLDVVPVRHLGERIHPATGRRMVYVACRAQSGTAHVASPDEITEIAWVDLVDLPSYIPSGIHHPVQEYLDSLLS